MKTFLGLVEVNVSFTLGELDERLQKFILDCGWSLTKDRYPTATINSFTTRKLWNKSTELGLRLMKADGILTLDLVHPAYNRETYYEGQENPEIHYVYFELGSMNRSRDELYTNSSIYYHVDVAKWLEQNHVEDIDDLFVEFVEILKNGKNFSIIENVDQELMEEALESGDLDLLEELMFDADPAEMIMGLM